MNSILKKPLFLIAVVELNDTEIVSIEGGGWIADLFWKLKCGCYSGNWELPSAGEQMSA